MNPEEKETSLTDSKVCAKRPQLIDTVILLAKGGCSQSLPDPEFSKQIDNLHLPNISTFYISPIQFSYINQEKLTRFLSIPNDWSGMIITSTRCVDALVLSLEGILDRTSLLDQWSKLMIFTIGDATNKYLFDKLQLNSIGYHTGNAASLAQFILECFPDKETCKPLIYPCSSIRSDSIMDILHGNIMVQEISCYETIANQQIDQDVALFKSFLSDSLQNINTNVKMKLIIIFFSPSGVEHLLPLLRYNILTNPYLIEHLTIRFVAFGKITALKMSEFRVDVWFVASSPNAKSLAVDISTNLKEIS